MENLPEKYQALLHNLGPDACQRIGMLCINSLMCIIDASVEQHQPVSPAEAADAFALQQIFIFFTNHAAEQQ